VKRSPRTSPQCTATNSLGFRCGHNAIPNSDKCQFHTSSEQPFEDLDPPIVEIKDPVEFSSAQEFAKAVLESEEFFDYVVAGIKSRKIPAVLILRLMDYAEGWGKPPERVEHTGKDGEAIVTEVRRVIVYAAPQEEPKATNSEILELDGEDLDIPLIPVAPRRMH
jgi:hypothetical protein